MRGDFAFDALSPDGRMLYLIQHLSAADTSRYIVRAYDIQNGVLLSGTIADKSQTSQSQSSNPQQQQSNLNVTQNPSSSSKSCPNPPRLMIGARSSSSIKLSNL